MECLGEVSVGRKVVDCEYSLSCPVGVGGLVRNDSRGDPRRWIGLLPLCEGPSIGLEGLKGLLKTLGLLILLGLQVVGLLLLLLLQLLLHGG